MKSQRDSVYKESAIHKIQFETRVRVLLIVSKLPIRADAHQTDYVQIFEKLKTKHICPYTKSVKIFS